MTPNNYSILNPLFLEELGSHLCPRSGYFSVGLYCLYCQLIVKIVMSLGGLFMDSLQLCILTDYPFLAHAPNYVNILISGRTDCKSWSPPGNHLVSQIGKVTGKKITIV